MPDPRACPRCPACGKRATAGPFNACRERTGPLMGRGGGSMKRCMAAGPGPAEPGDA